MLLTTLKYTGADALWIGRDLGYRGGRRTGIPLTDDLRLSELAVRLKVDDFSIATRDGVVTERTATVVWSMLEKIQEHVMFWNVFPFHPHPEGDEFANRAHTSKERQIARPILDSLIEIVKPKFIVAIGRDAQNALCDIDIPVHAVRHPSYGGQREFIEGISKAHNLPTIIQEQPLLELH